MRIKLFEEFINEASAPAEVINLAKKIQLGTKVYGKELTTGRFNGGIPWERDSEDKFIAEFNKQLKENGFENLFDFDVSIRPSLTFKAPVGTYITIYINTDGFYIADRISDRFIKKVENLRGTPEEVIAGFCKIIKANLPIFNELLEM
jgi:hypothetical protein